MRLAKSQAVFSFAKTMDKEKLEALITSSSKVVGSKQVLKGMSDGTVRCVIIASDADAEFKHKIVAQAEQCHVDVTFVPSKKRLGEVAGVEVAAAVVGLKRTAIH